MNVAVIGAGVMGTGVAHNMAQYGISTNVVDNVPNAPATVRKYNRS